MAVQAGNEVTLDFIEADGEITPQHYAFFINEAEFDEIFARIRERKLSYWADPGQHQCGEINTRWLARERPSGGRPDRRARGRGRG